MSKPMSYYEEKYIYTHEAKETKKCPMGWDQSCYGCMHCFPGHYEQPDDYKGKDVCMECKRQLKELFHWEVNVYD